MRLGWLVAALMLCGRTGDAQSRWTRLQSDHFEFVGNASEKNIRNVALHLEQFREVLSRILPAAVRTTVPTIVYVFQSDASLTPYKPTFNGKPVALAGFFSGWTDRNLIAINAAAEQSALTVVFHEYAHFLVQNAAGPLPPWANEGLAGFYETFREEHGGRGALIGVAKQEHIALLRRTTLMPLRDLLAITYTSPEYNEGDRRGLFYAEAWALMHYLQLGSKLRASQLAQYLDRLHNGASHRESFEATFGDLVALERELQNYLRSFSFPSVRLEFDAAVKVTGAGAAEVLSGDISASYLADLLARMGHVDEARRRLQNILDANPRSTAAAAALGVLEVNAGNADRALPWLELAATDPSHTAAQVLWSRAVIERSVRTLNEGGDPGSLSDLRQVLARAAELRPDDAETLATLGRAESVAGEDRRKAIALLERAVKLAPGQDEYRLMLAEALVQQRQYARAKDILGPLAAGARRADVRDAATRVLSHAIERQNELARAAAAAAAAGRPMGPRFRLLRPDESRVAGQLTAVDCQSGAIVLHVETPDESLRFSAASVVAVQFIRYQTSDQRTLMCGAVDPPARVFATYRESDAVIQATGIDGRAIAIEVLPDDYEVR